MCVFNKFIKPVHLHAHAHTRLVLLLNRFLILSQLLRLEYLGSLTMNDKLDRSVKRSKGVPDPSLNSDIDDSSRSKAIMAADDETFAATTFALKRTRSLGILDNFIEQANNYSEKDINTLPNSVNPCGEPSDKSSGKSSGHVPTIVEKSDLTPEPLIPLEPQEAAYNHDQTHHIFNEKTVDLTVPPDDSSIKHEPAQHVDYFSHNWNERDIFASWKYIVMNSRNVAKSARLENASWRSWTKSKYNLKTVPPESVNWSKDCDITSLIGPLYNEQKPSPFLDTIDSNTDTRTIDAQAQQTDIPTKSILKKKTIPEMIVSNGGIFTDHIHQHSHDDDSSSARHHEQDSSYARHHKYRQRIQIDSDSYELSTSRIKNGIYSNSSKALNGLLNGNNKANPTRHELPLSINSKTSSEFGKFNTANSSLTSSTSSLRKSDRHIHFNNRVQQCIAVDVPRDTIEKFEDNDFATDDHDFKNMKNKFKEPVSDSDSDSEDEGGFFLNVRSASSSSLHKSGFTLSPMKENNNNNLSTITMLPATTLKNPTDDDEEILEGYNTETEPDYFSNAISHNTNTSRGYDYRYEYNKVYHTSNYSNYDGAGSTDNNMLSEGGTPTEIVSIPINIGSQLKDQVEAEAKQFKPPARAESYRSSFLLENDSSESDESDDAH